jgi:tetratricopeptide (TPR) repeat protein
MLQSKMNPYKKYILLFSFLLILQACSSKTRTDVGPVPVEDRSVENSQGKVENFPAEADANKLHKKKNVRLKNTDDQPMVVALLEDAETKMKAGDNVSAAGTLERALRLEPKNAMLWYRLGLIRLQQKNWQQAINLAKKSNSLAAGDYVLQTKNWKLIAEANFRAGNNSAASLAFERARELEELK